MIHISNLFFSYNKEPFIENLSLDIKKGEIFSFLGPSGAGKSTLSKIMLGILRSYSGSVVVDGTECRNAGRSFYDNIGVMMEYPSVYLKLTGKENLDFFSSLHTRRRDDMDALVEKIGLLNDMKRKTGEYSKGMKTRLCFLIAIAHAPSLIFLDEPMSGLDPESRRVVSDMMRMEKKRGATIVMTTHDMEAAATLSDRTAFIVNGSVVLEGRVEDILAGEGEKSVRYTWKEDGKTKEGTTPLSFISSDKKLRELMESNMLSSISTQSCSLGDVFMKVTGKTLC
ncbi:MAG: ABC transporter ATP-binding protein [Candidatus Ornithospirochaeta sp.]